MNEALYAKCDAALDRAGAPSQRVSIWVPGRIEVAGKHTDYAGGRSLVCAVERGFHLRVAARGDTVVRAIDGTRGASFTTALDPAARFNQGEWGAYVTTVARRIARDFPGARRGADIAFASDLPSSAGLSSSSALVVGMALALIHANTLDDLPDFRAAVATTEDLAGYLGAAENGLPFGPFPGDTGVGTFGGSEDHTAMLCSVLGSLSMFSYAPVRREAQFPLMPAYTFAVAASGITANKAGGALAQYNRLSSLTRRLLMRSNQATNRSDRTLASALSHDSSAVSALSVAVAESNDAEEAGELLDRLAQFTEENFELVPAIANAFQRGDTNELGGLVDRSQHLAETLLRNQTPETIALQRQARELGAAAASAFGAGFGGSVWALVREGDARLFVDSWARKYRSLYPGAGVNAVFFVTSPGAPAHLVTV